MKKAIKLCMIYELVLTLLFIKELIMLDKVTANWPILGFCAWLKEMSQREGQKKTAPKLTQPLNKEGMRRGSPEGLKETMKQREMNLKTEINSEAAEDRKN